MASDESNSEQTLWLARQNVIKLYGRARKAENHVLEDELADIEHRLCLVGQILHGGDWRFERDLDTDSNRGGGPDG